MVRHKLNFEKVNEPKGGKGTADMYHIMEPNEFYGHGKLFNHVVLKPHSLIGWHQHESDFEVYYILKGQPDYIDNDRTKTRLLPGEMASIKVGDYHSLENNTDDDVEFIALILFDEKK